MHRFRSAHITAAVAAIAVVTARPATAVSNDIHSYVASKLDDFQATMQVVNVNERELGKISRDAVFLYTIKTVHVHYKEPNMVRIEGTKDGSNVTFVLNGPIQWVKINQLKTRRDFGNSPGKRKSLMDVGLISNYYLTYTDARFLREGTVDGVACGVFDLSYKDKDDTSHSIVYVDPKTKVVLKRESYSQNGPQGQPGHLQATYFYKDVKEVAPGIWFPTLIEAYNADRALAGTTAYRDVEVNKAMSDNLFRL